VYRGGVLEYHITGILVAGSVLTNFSANNNDSFVTIITEVLHTPHSFYHLH